MKHVNARTAKMQIVHAIRNNFLLIRCFKGLDFLNPLFVCIIISNEKLYYMKWNTEIDLDKHNVWFTSDLHLFHGNIIWMNKRPFKDVNEMYENISKMNGIQK